MSNKHIEVTEADLPMAREYISNQFAAHSWWPRAQPGEAKREYDLMHGSATALNVWCARWLDTRQCQQLEKTLGSR